MMAGSSLEERVAVLEEEVARLRRLSSIADGSQVPWWEEIFGKFAGEPMFQEAMELGREYRRSQPMADEEPTDS